MNLNKDAVAMSHFCFRIGLVYSFYDFANA